MIFQLCLLVLQIVHFGSAEVQPRVYNGTLARDGQFPYLVGIGIENFYKSFWCGGNVISTEWILTAAHCFESFLPWSKGNIYFGATVREQGLKIPFKYENVFKHYAYKFIHDLALIKIAKVRFFNNIRAIPLPSFKDKTKSYAGQLALTAGWNAKDHPKPEQLMWTSVKIASGSECKKKFSTNGEVLCGRVNPGSSICTGDSGGPLVHKKKLTLIGVASFTSGERCDNGELMGFVNVIKYLDWICKVSGVKPFS